MFIFSQLYYYILGLRPKQWIKNSIIFLPLVFSGEAMDGHAVMATFWLFLLFCMWSGVTYHINDYCDLENDKRHPVKSRRPLASGKLSQVALWVFSLVITLGVIRYLIMLNNLIIALGFGVYTINTLLYSFVVKKYPIVDIFAISIGFIIRGILGCAIIGVVISERLILMLFFGSLFFGFVKRYQEYKLGTVTRSVLQYYNEGFLEHCITLISSVILIVYALYSFQSVQSNLMVFTVPLVAFGILRIVYHIFVLQKYKDSLENMILQDIPILICCLIYILCVVFIKYGHYLALS